MTKYSAEEQHKRMTETPIPKIVTAMALPTTAIQLISVLYNSADTFFVGKINNSASAAVGAAFSLLSLIQALSFGLGMGASSLISRRLGAKDNEAADKYFSSAITCEAAVGLFIFIFGLIFLKPLMKLLGATETMLPYSCAYAKYIVLFAPFNCLSFCLNVSLRAEGRATFSAIGMCSGSILNMVLDPLFIFGFHIGTGGAGLATGIGQFTSFLILLVPFLRKQTALRFGTRKISRKGKDYLDIIRTGLPTICRQGVASVASALLNNAVVRMDMVKWGGAANAAEGENLRDAAVSAITIANKIYTLVRSVILGIGQGFQPVAGYNYGAGKKDRVRKAFTFTTVVGTAIGTVAAVVLAIFAKEAVGLFRNDPDVIRFGAPAVIYLAACLPFLAYSTYVNQMYQCLGFSLPATILACCHQGIFYIPLILFLPKLLGILGCELTQPIADLLTFVVSVPFQVRFFRKQLSGAGKLNLN